LGNCTPSASAIRARREPAQENGHLSYLLKIGIPGTGASLKVLGSVPKPCFWLV
jgi:hypothetical protein